MRDRRPARFAASLLSALPLAVLALAVAMHACNDTSPPSNPGNTLVDNSHQDAIAQVTQDVAAPATTYDGGLDALGASTAYADVVSPQVACSTCTCDPRIAFCLENGTSLKVTAPPVDAACGYAPTNQLQVGCNILPPACAANPTCQCILDSVQPPLPCYPECTDPKALGYFDVFCSHP